LQEDGIIRDSPDWPRFGCDFPPVCRLWQGAAVSESRTRAVRLASDQRSEIGGASGGADEVESTRLAPVVNLSANRRRVVKVEKLPRRPKRRAEAARG
jgi:hypothetical protein